MCANMEGKKDMAIAAQSIAKSPKPIPKTQIGLNYRQKDILKSYVGKAPEFPIDLNTVRDWEKQGLDVYAMTKEDKRMSTLLNSKYSYLKDKLNDISKDAPIRNGKDGMIELDPKNPHHIEWFENDQYKGE